MICKHISHHCPKTETDFHMQSKNLLEPTHLHYLLSALLGGERVFLSSVCTESKLTESGSEYEFPELPRGGQTEDTVPMAGAVPCIVAMAFLQLSSVTEGQKLKLASECNVCAPFLQHFPHRDHWDLVRLTVF